MFTRAGANRLFSILGPRTCMRSSASELRRFHILARNCLGAGDGIIQSDSHFQQIEDSFSGSLQSPNAAAVNKFLERCEQSPPPTRAQLLWSLNETYSEEETLYIGEKVIQSLIESDISEPKARWTALRNLTQPYPLALRVLQDNRSPLIDEYLVKLLHWLREDADYVTAVDVLNVLKLLGYTNKLSEHAALEFHRASDVLARELQWVGVHETTRPQLRLVEALGVKIPRKYHPEDTSLVLMCYSNLTYLLDSHPIPQSRMEMSLLGQVALASVQLGIYDEDFLNSFASYLTAVVRTARCLRLQNANTLGLFLLAFSYLGHPASELFRAAKLELEEDAMVRIQWEHSHDENPDLLRPYVNINWSFLCQGIEPPASTMRVMWCIFEKHRDAFLNRSVRWGGPLGSHMLDLLDQIVAHVPDDASYLSTHCFRPQGSFLGGWPLTSAIRQHLPGLHLAQERPSGTLWLYGLADPSTGCLRHWPRQVAPETVTKAAELDGCPIAVLFSSQHDKLRNTDRYNGVLACKLKLLHERGWRVVFIPKTLDAVRSVSAAIARSVLECDHTL